MMVDCLARSGTVYDPNCDFVKLPPSRISVGCKGTSFVGDWMLAGTPMLWTIYFAETNDNLKCLCEFVIAQYPVINSSVHKELIMMQCLWVGEMQFSVLSTVIE